VKPTEVAKRVELVARWARDYDSMTFEQHRDVYSEYWQTNLPEQAHFDYDAVARHIDFDFAHVCEIGGWDGQLAAAVLRAPGYGATSWTNFEVCKEAADLSRATVANPARFSAFADGWAWEQDLSGMDVLIASHSLEHMNRRHLGLLLDATAHMGQAYVQAPLQMGVGHQSTHILGLTPDELVAEFTARGWKLTYRAMGRDMVAVFRQ
jgi:hypothetical protein